MRKARGLKLLWEVVRSRGGTGDHWLHLRVERNGEFEGMASCSLSPPGKETPRGLCMTALHMIDKYIKSDKDKLVIANTLQYRLDSCPHKWVTCSETQVLFCWHCDSLQSDFAHKAVA